MEKRKAKIWCDNCDEEIELMIESASDLFGVVCPICSSERVWIRDVERDEDEDFQLELGKGGCLHA